MFKTVATDTETTTLGDDNSDVVEETNLTTDDVLEVAHTIADELDMVHKQYINEAIRDFDSILTRAKGGYIDACRSVTSLSNTPNGCTITAVG